MGGRKDQFDPRNLRNLSPEDQQLAIVTESDRRYHSYQAEVAALEKEREINEDRLGEVQYDISTTKQQDNLNQPKARLSVTFGYLSGLLGLCLIAANTAMSYETIAPSFYGRLEFLGYLVAGGSGVCGALGAEFLLRTMSKVLEGKAFLVFLLIVTLATFISGAGGGIMLSHSRSELSKIQEYMTNQSVLDDKPSMTEQEFKEIKAKIATINNRAMALLWISLEFLAGLSIFTGLRAIRRYSPYLQLCKTQRKIQEKIILLEREIAHLRQSTPKSIANDILRNIPRNNRVRNQCIAACLAAAVVLASIVTFVTLADAGKRHKPAFYALGWDISGHQPTDRAANERFILTFINKLKPSDRLVVAAIHQSAWSSGGEYVIDAVMPFNPGFYGEVLKSAKRRLINEFKTKAKSEKYREGRPGTALIEGLHLLANLLRSDPQRAPTAILLSDMREYSSLGKASQIIKNPKKAAQALKRKNMIPDLSGIKVYAIGVSTARTSVWGWKQMELFWREVFSLAGGNLLTYTMERPIQEIIQEKGN